MTSITTMNNCANTSQSKTNPKKRKYQEVTTDEEQEIFPISKFGNIIEKTRFLSDMFDQSSKKFQELHERFKQIENDWKHYYLYYYLDDEPKQ